MGHALRSLSRDFRDGYVPEIGSNRPEAMSPNSIYDGEDVIIRDGSVQKRNGFLRLNLRPVEYLSIRVMESGEVWTGTTNEAVIFKQGTGSKKITSTGLNTIGYSDGAFNMGGAVASDLIEMWMYTTHLYSSAGAATSTGFIKQIRFRFYTTVSTAYFEYTWVVDSTVPYEITSGWNKFSKRKDAFSTTGAANWASIVRVEIQVTLNKSFWNGTDPFILVDDLIVTTPTKIMALMDYIKRDATQMKLVQAGTKVYNSTTIDTDWTAIVTGLTAGKRLGWDIANDHLIAGNGTDANFKYKAAKTNLGIVGPPAAPTFNANINGGMPASGVFFYRFIYVNSTTAHRSNPSPASASMSAAADPNDGIRVNIPADGGYDTQVDKVWLYRTLDGAPVTSEYYRVPGEIAYAGAGTTFDDTYKDSELLDDLLQYDNDVPNKFTMVAHDGSYTYYAGDPNNPSRVWRSKASDPESVPVTSYVDVAKDDGDVITALRITENNIVVAFKRNSKYRIVDLGGGVLTARYINRRGTWNQETARVIPDGIAYANDDNFFVYTGNSDNPIGGQIRSDIRTWADSSVTEAVVGYDRYDNVIRMAVVLLGQTNNSRELAYDLHEKAWVKHKKAYSAIGNYMVNGRPIDCVGDYNGYVYRNEEPSVDDDDGRPIDAFVKTPYDDMEFPGQIKKFRTVVIWVRAQGNYNLNMNFIKGYSPSAGDQVLVPLISGALWGTFVWGVDVWGSESVLRIEVPVPQAEMVANALQLRFGTQGMNQPFAVRKYQHKAQILRKTS